MKTKIKKKGIALKEKLLKETGEGTYRQPLRKAIEYVHGYIIKTGQKEKTKIVADFHQIQDFFHFAILLRDKGLDIDGNTEEENTIPLKLGAFNQNNSETVMADAFFDDKIS